MVDNTNRFGLNTYSQGDTAWDHTDTVQTIDELAIERGAVADRPDSGDYDDELYLATDQQILYRWDATATDWIVEGVGSETDPLPKVWANKIDATNATIDGVESPYATDSHDNTAHSETFAVDGDKQPPETHDNTAHSETFAVDGDAQPPETHDNTAHSETFAVDGDAQPPETHDNTAHSETFAVDGDAQPPETHDNDAHSETFATETQLNNLIDIDVGYFDDGTTSITTGFEPQYVEITGQIHLSSWNNENSTSGEPLGQCHGYASGTADSDQFVVTEGDNSDSVNGHYTFVGDSDVIYLIKTSNSGESVDSRSRASIESFDSDGFTLDWSTTGADGYYIYKAFK